MKALIISLIGLIMAVGGERLESKGAKEIHEAEKAACAKDHPVVTRVLVRDTVTIEKHDTIALEPIIISLTKYRDTCFREPLKAKGHYYVNHDSLNAPTTHGTVAYPIEKPPRHYIKDSILEPKEYRNK
jgi:hypothetical protein